MNSNVTWSSALTAATSSTLNGIAGELVTIGSRYENDLVWSLARSINNDVWLGASDEGPKALGAGTTVRPRRQPFGLVPPLVRCKAANTRTGEQVSPMMRVETKIMVTCGLWTVHGMTGQAP